MLIFAEILTHILSHLPPSSLATISLVSQKFHSLVTTPHAWRIAFSRYFPGTDALTTWDDTSGMSDTETENFRLERRVFTRLTVLASWRSEYILRTQLLRSLARGKPAQLQMSSPSSTSRSNSGGNGNAQVTYNSNLSSTVNHLQATFGTGLNKRLPRFIHGTDEIGSVSSSDPSTGKVDQWGFADPQSFLQFVDRFPGDSEYGLGAGDMVGVPNSMDVSQMYGMVYAEGFPGGLVYYRSTEEQRGRSLSSSLSLSNPELGIPRLDPSKETMCSVWIAKTSNIPSLSDGLIGILSGSSYGVVTAYSLGTNSLRERRFERGEITARWVLSPGVPIIAIIVDESYSVSRREQNRIWAVVLSALGEVFYLNDLPIRGSVHMSAKLSDRMLDQTAWATGRTSYWYLIEVTRRAARLDPFDRSDVDGSYSPRSSWNGMGLSKQQIVAETKEIETFIGKQPKHFLKVCEGWDMIRRLEVDFAGDDENGAGEGIFVISRALEEGASADIKRYTRCHFEQISDELRENDGLLSKADWSPNEPKASIIGGSDSVMDEAISWSFDATCNRRNSATSSEAEKHTSLMEEWRTSTFSFRGLKSIQIITTAIDMSTFALLTISEDPLLNIMASSAASSPPSSPLGQFPRPTSPSDIPGQRSRFIAVGTKTGTIVLWNMRAPFSSNSSLINTISPVRIIHTDSPRISCLALSALYLIHGGNDGLVQAWDPLASNTQPIRTLNSRFSSRARRRLVQAEASAQGVGINLFAAGAICLDPDPTILRGMVSLGTHLRYWSYSSSTADQYKSSKRRLRRFERGSNQATDRFSGTSRGMLKDYIANERLELEREKEHKRKEKERLAGRFGLDLLGPEATEDEIMAYATLLSEEALKSDELRRKSASESSNGDSSSETVMETLGSSTEQTMAGHESIDADVAEALRLSLEEHEIASVNRRNRSPRPEIPISYVKGRKSPPPSPFISGTSIGSSQGLENDNLDFAMQLSIAEEKSRKNDNDEEFPALASSASPTGSGKAKENGKGKRNTS